MAPPVTAGLIGHYDATSIVGLGEDDDVATWADESGLGADFLAAHGTDRPKYRAAAFKGGTLPGVHIGDDGNRVFTIDGDWNFSAATSLTFFAVVRPQAWHGTNPGLWGTGAAGNSLEALLAFQGTSGLPLVWWNNAQRLAPGSGAAVSLDQATVVTFRIVDNSVIEFYIDGVLRHSVALATSADAFIVRNFGWHFSVNERVEGEYGEILVYDEALSESDRESVEEYLLTKWMEAGTNRVSQASLRVGVLELEDAPGTNRVSQAALRVGVVDYVPEGEPEEILAVRVGWIEVEADYADVPAGPTLSVTYGDTWAELTTTSFVPGSSGDVHVSTVWEVTTFADTEFLTPLVGENSSTLLTAYSVEGLTPETGYRARAAHVGSAGQGPYSNVVTWTTLAEQEVPDTPTITILDVGEDFVIAEGSAFSHPDGETTAAEFDPADPMPYLGSVQWQVRNASTLALVHDPGAEPPTALETTVLGLAAATGYEIRHRQRDGYTGAWSAWTAWLAFTTDAVPGVRPDTPTLTLVSCGPGPLDGIELDGSAFSHPDGLATHETTHWRICQGGACHIFVTTDGALLEDFTWSNAPEADYRLSVRYLDDSGRASEWSNEVECTILPLPPQPEITSPVGGASISEATLIEWDMPPTPVVAWEFEAQRSDDSGGTWTALASGFTTESYTFQISGLANGRYIFRVRACYPDVALCGEWAYLSLLIDRTEQAAVVLDFRDLDEIPSGWLTLWDPEILYALVDRDLETDGAPIGILATSTASTSEGDKRGVLAFPDFGQPVEGRITCQLAVLEEECVWPGWRFSHVHLKQGGLAFRATGTTPAGTSTGVATTAHAGLQPWPLRPGGTCTECSPCHCETCIDEEDEVTGEQRDVGLCPGASPETAVWSANHLGVLYLYGIATGPAGVVGHRLHNNSYFIFDPGSVPYEGAHVRGMSLGYRPYVEDPLPSCRYRPVWYQAELDFRRVSGNLTRIRMRVMGPGLDSSDWHLDHTMAVEDVMPCGYVGLCATILQSNLYNGEGILFRSFAMTEVSYERCLPPEEEPLLPCTADWDFTVFEDDDVTPWYGTADAEGWPLIADFYSTRDCPRPYLMTPRDFSETEIDFPAGASTIGAIKVGVLDKRLTEDDQDTGIVTAKISEAIGRRALLRRWREDLGMVTVFDGVIHSYEVDEASIVTYWFHLRDPREREREVELFSRNETFAVYASLSEAFPAPTYGPILPYGELPDGTHLVPAVVPYQAESWQRQDSGDPYETEIYWGYASIRLSDEEHRALVLSVGDASLAEDGFYYYRDMTIRWRLQGGSDWIYLRDMPRDWGGSAFAQPGVISIPSVILGRGVVYFGSFDPEDIPPDGASIEYQVLAVRTTEATPFVWDKGTFGDLLTEIYRGDYTQSPPAIRYSESALAEWAENTPRARLIQREPVKDLRQWVEEHIYAPVAHAPSFDEDMRIIPQAWELPDAGETLVTLDPDWIIPAGNWGDGTDSVINRVEYTYIREGILPPDSFILRLADLAGMLPRWTRLYQQEVIRTYLFAPSTFMGLKTISYEPSTVRSIGDSTGLPISGDTRDELGSQLAEQIGTMVLDRFGWGAPQFECGVRAGMAHGPTFDPHTLDLRVGQWVQVEAPWQPEYSTGTRGAARYMQIASIKDEEIHQRRIRLIDGGPALPALDPPVLGGLTVTSDDRVLVAVLTFPVGAPADYTVRVDYAQGASAPDEDSGQWRMAGRTSDEGSVVMTPPIGSGGTVWIRARGEAPQRRPSEWTTPTSTGVTPAPGFRRWDVALAGGTPTVFFTPNDMTEGIRIRYSVGAIGHTPSYTLWGDVDADNGSQVLTGVTVEEGEEIYVEGTAYPGWTAAGGVSGSPGSQYITHETRPDPESPYLEWAIVYRSDDGDCAMAEPLTHEIQWSLAGGYPGYTVEIDRGIDGAAPTLLASGLTSSPYSDELTGYDHDVTNGTRTEYQYVVRLVRTADGDTVSTANTGLVVSYLVECES